MTRKTCGFSSKGSGSDAQVVADALTFPVAFHIRASGCRPEVRNVAQALEMIEDDLPAELRRLPRWTFAKALLEEANRSRRKKDLTAAARQFRQALSNEGWFVETKSPRK
jgi:hypothetical protein